jgi:tRNA-modifying protein YgfZ
MKGRGKTTLNMRTPWHSVPLDSLGVLRARGPDARKFLQGQLSNDMSRLAPERALLAGYHNVQGRVIALLRLIEISDDDFIAILPRELVTALGARLGKFVLRAKVKLSDDSPAWQVLGALVDTAADSGAEPPAALPATGGVTRIAGSHIVRIGESPARLLLVRPAGSPLSEGHAPLALRDWQLAAIAAGEPQVYAATSEEFVSQMLNLDVLEGISFEKGCYTGQEVIARAHFRGRVKRRMQRFLTDSGAALAPGDSARLADGRPVTVVEAAQRTDGRCEFLAVAGLSAETEAAAEISATRALPAQQLPLPYTLPR